uniref:Uncharacterized protein n=1 Tax=Anguilla anguilla TaxID=7936 RepID=A0A0E9QT96_ANGAN
MWYLNVESCFSKNFSSSSSYSLEHCL